MKDLQTYQSELSGEEMAALTELIKEQTDFKILSVEENGDRAEAKVALTLPDLSEMMGDFMALAFQSALSEKGEGPSETDIAEALEKYKGKDLPKTTEEQTFQLVREEDGWRIFSDWRTDQLLAEARELQEAENYKAARRRILA